MQYKEKWLYTASNHLSTMLIHKDCSRLFTSYLLGHDALYWRKAELKILNVSHESDHNGVNRASVSISCSCEGERGVYFIFFRGGLQCIISRIRLLRFSYLIKFLKLHNLEENVLQDVLRIPLIFIQLWCHPQNFTTFPYIEFKIIICACEWNRLKDHKL